MPAQVRLLHRVLGVSHRSEHAVGETEQAPAVRLEGRGRVRQGARGAHVTRPALKAVRPLRVRASPPIATPINPNTNAAAPPTTPLPEPGPPLATATFSEPLTAAISPSTRPRSAARPTQAVPKRLTRRVSASPPTVTPSSAIRAAAVAQ